MRHTGLFPVHFKKQFPFDERDDVGQGSLCTPFAFTEYHAVIGIAHKLMSALFQFLVQFVQHNVAEQGT